MDWDILTQLVARAIEARLDVLHGQSEELINDMQAALHRMDTQGTKAYFGDIRVGKWHRYSTEMTVLQWFRAVLEGSTMPLYDQRRMVRDQLQQRIQQMHAQSLQLVHDMRRTLDEVDTTRVHEWTDVRVGGWYKATTETRVYRWLLNSVSDLQEGRAPAELDQEECATEEDEEATEEN